MNTSQDGETQDADAAAAIAAATKNMQDRLNAENDENNETSVRLEDVRKVSEQAEEVRLMMLRMNQRHLEAEMEEERLRQEELAKIHESRREERERRAAFEMVNRKADDTQREVEAAQKRLEEPLPSVAAKQAERGKLIAMAKARAAQDKKLRNDSLGLVRPDPTASSPVPPSPESSPIQQPSPSSNLNLSPADARFLAMEMRTAASSAPTSDDRSPNKPTTSPAVTQNVAATAPSTSPTANGSLPPPPALGISREDARRAALSKAKRERLEAAARAREETLQKEARLNALIMAAEDARIAKEKEALLREALDLEELDQVLDDLDAGKDREPIITKYSGTRLAPSIDATTNADESVVRIRSFAAK